MSRSAWVRAVPIERLADPCITRAASATGTTITATTLCIAGAVYRHHNAVRHPAAPRQPTGFCRHAIEIDGRVCTTLAHELPGVVGSEPVVGLLHVADLIEDAPDVSSIDVSPPPLSAFEASPEELALSYDELMALEAWTPANCESNAKRLSQRAGQTWGHMIFVSHAWRGDMPGDRADLEQIKRAVSAYVADVLGRSNSRFNIDSAVVKNVRKPQDFGIWVDYMVVPNDPTHDACAACKRQKEEHIAKVGALLTISTIIAMDPEMVERGWIIHETTGNSHDNIIHGRQLRSSSSRDVRHRHRARLMAAGHKAFRVKSDGPRLRCYEMLRLGQMPRCWPTVNCALLDEFESEGVTDERSEEAKDALYRYARGFGLDCHGLKVAMITLARDLAWNPSSPSETVDLESLARAVEEQTVAMRRLHARLGSSPEQDDGLLPITQSVALVQRLQLQQFVEVAMGLRAELTRGAGFASWVKLTELVDALSATKFMARLFDGVVTLKKVSCTVSLADDPPGERKRGVAWNERLAHAEDLALAGVRMHALAGVHDVLETSE